MSDCENYDDAGWTKIGRHGRVKKDVALHADEDQLEEYSWHELPRRTAFPPIASLIGNSAPFPTAPRPLDEGTLKRHEQATSEIQALKDSIAVATSKAKKTEKELSDLKAASASVNKWSSTHKTAAASSGRLTLQLAAENAVVEEQKKKLDKCAAGWKATLDYVSAHKKCEENWEDYKELVARHEKEEAEQEAALARDVARALRKAATAAAETRARAAAPPEPWVLALAATTLY